VIAQETFTGEEPGGGTLSATATAPVAVPGLLLPLMVEKPWFKALAVASSAVTVSEGTVARSTFVRMRPLPPLVRSGPRPLHEPGPATAAPAIASPGAASVSAPKLGAGSASAHPPAYLAVSEQPPALRTTNPIQREGRDISLDISMDRLERDLTILRREINRLQSDKRGSDLDLLEARRAARDCEQRLEKVKATISFQLGSALVDSRKSLSNALYLPQRLYYVFRSSRALRQRTARARADMPATLAKSAEAAHMVTTAVSMVKSVGADQALSWVRAQEAQPAALAQALVEIAHTLAAAQPLQASTLGVEAVALDPGTHRCKPLAFRLGDLGHIRLAVALVDKAVVAGTPFNKSETMKVERLRAQGRFLDSPPVIPAPGRAQTPAAGRRVLLVGRQSLPYDSGTLAQRLEDRAAAIEAAGWAVTIATPPGYPSGRSTRLAPPEAAVVPHAPARQYTRLAAVAQGPDLPDLYLPQAAEKLAAIAGDFSVIQADGYTINGVAAAFAARAAGRPLVLEFDEFFNPHAPFPAGFERTELGQMELWSSLIAARAADMCLVASPALAEVLHGAGVDRSRVMLMPHRHTAPAPDTTARATLAAQHGLGGGPVIGVVRDLCESYDTTVLADVVAALAAPFPEMKLLVVGYGRAGGLLRQRLAERHLSGRLVLIEQPDSAELALYQSLLDVAIFTRHDGLKCQMLSAYEVSQAMAASRAIVAYRTSDAAAMIEDGVTGLLCAPDSVGELVEKVRQLLADGPLRAKLASGAHRAYLAATTPAAAVQDFSNLYQRLLAPELQQERQLAIA
jgi:glycosyltransferase involved in cell wall biosynthesis